MEFEPPMTKGFTIYSKSGCPSCVKVKNLLINHTFTIVDCDEYLFDERDNFLLFIKELSGQDVKTFPMVFNDAKFVGGYQDTKTFIEQRPTLDFNEDF
jgi:glutaredoxin